MSIKTDSGACARVRRRPGRTGVRRSEGSCGSGTFQYDSAGADRRSLLPSKPCKGATSAAPSDGGRPSAGHHPRSVGVGSLPQQPRLATVARRGVTRPNLSLAPSSIFVRFLRMFRPFHGDAEDFGFLRPRKTWNTMTRRNQRWRCEYARIGDCDVGRQSAAGDPTPPGAAGSVGSHARQAMRTFRQPAQRRV